jgi:Flp pilus assembly protein TadB
VSDSLKKPGNLIAAWWNITICGAIVVGAVVFGIKSNGFGFLVAIVGVVLEVVFVRILLQILKERREQTASVGMPEDSEQNEAGSDEDAPSGGNHHSPG